MNDSNIISEQSQFLTNRDSKPILQMDFLQSSVVQMSPEYASGVIQTKQQDKMREYLQESAKDINRYNDIKDNLRHKYFRINAPKQRRVKSNYTSPKFSKQISSLQKSKQWFTRNSSPIKDYSAELRLLLSESLKLRESPKKKKFRSGSQKQKKNKALIKQQRRDIIDLINRSAQSQLPLLRDHQHSNKEKYSLNYMAYLRMKTKQSIDKQFFEKKIRKKQSIMDKFQDFILKEVKFSQEDKVKLQKFFMSIRHQFEYVNKKYPKQEPKDQESDKN